MKKNYIQPAFEVLAVSTAYNVCQVVSYTQTTQPAVAADPGDAL